MPSTVGRLTAHATDKATQITWKCPRMSMWIQEPRNQGNCSVLVLIDNRHYCHSFPEIEHSHFLFPQQINLLDVLTSNNKAVGHHQEIPTACLFEADISCHYFHALAYALVQWMCDVHTSI